MIVVAAGMRNWPNREQVFEALDVLLQRHIKAWRVLNEGNYDMFQAAQAFVLRHGASGNADIAANDWGIERGVTIERFPAEWHDPVTGAYQPWAGPKRNREMAEKQPKADLWLAFWDGKFKMRNGKPVSGTFGGICIALENNIDVSIKYPRTQERATYGI